MFMDLIKWDDDSWMRSVRIEIEPDGPGILVLSVWRGDRLIDCLAGAAETILARARSWFSEGGCGEHEMGPRDIELNTESDFHWSCENLDPSGSTR